MSAPLAMAGLAEQLERFGATAYLVSVGIDGLPHVVAVRVVRIRDELAVAAGPRTQTNVAERPGVSLLWPAPAGEGYALIVDGRAERFDGDAEAAELPELAEPTVRIRPTAAVLHRTPEGDPAAPSCIRVLPRP